MIASEAVAVAPADRARRLGRYPLPAMDGVVSRTMDAAFLNGVANHPEVRPWIGGDGPIDLTAVLADPAHIAVVTEDGGFVGIAQGAGRYEVHSLFLPTRQSGATVRAMRAALDVIFAETDAVELVTQAPLTNLRAIGLARLAGFTPLFTASRLWSAGQRVAATFSALSLDQWALRSGAALVLGGWLHDAMDAAKRDAHSTLGDHSADDEAHHRMAGAATLMVRAGNARKGVDFYNRWAHWAGYPPIRLLAEHPVVIDLEGIVVEARHDAMEMLACR